MFSGGEPARVVVSGVPEVPGATMMDKRNYMMVRLPALQLRDGAFHSDVGGGEPSPRADVAGVRPSPDVGREW